MALPSGFPDRSTFLSLELAPHPVCRSLWQVSHISSISNILGCRRKCRLHLPALPSGLSGHVSVAFLSRKQLLSEFFYPLIASRTISAPESIREFCLLVQSVVPEQTCLCYFCSFNNSLTSCAWATVLVLLC